MIEVGVAYRLMAIGVAVILTTACTEPDLAETAPATTDSDDVLSEPALDPARDALVETLATLTETLTAIQAELEVAATSESTSGSRAAANAALGLLLDDPEMRSPDEPSLFPSRTTEREEPADLDDLLSATLTAAREAGGDLGRATVEALREPVAGDLGAWERDAEGVVASAAAVVEGVRDVDAVAEEVLLLPADGLRALAWTLLATETADAEVTREAAARASAHMSVVLIGIGLLDTSEPDDDDDPAEDGDDA